MAKSAIPTVQIKAKLFCGFSDRSRLAILETLRDGARNVGDIAEATGLTQPNVSNHLKCLSECGLVIGEPNGRFVHYRLTDPRIARLLRLADELLAECAEGILSCKNYREKNADAARPRDARQRKPVRAIGRKTAA